VRRPGKRIGAVAGVYGPRHELLYKLL
jgi:hypothetical protein